jgi:hypothetical protein
MDSFPRTRNAAPTMYIKRNKPTMSLRARYLHDDESLGLVVSECLTHHVVTAFTEILHPQPKHHAPLHRDLNISRIIPSLRAHHIEHAMVRPSNPMVRDKKFGVMFPPPPPPTPTPTWDSSATPPTHVERYILLNRARPELPSRFSSWSSASSTQSSSSLASVESQTPSPDCALTPTPPPTLLEQVRPASLLSRDRAGHIDPNILASWARPELHSRFSSRNSMTSLPSAPEDAECRLTGLARVIDHGGSVAISSLVEPVSRASSVASSVARKMRRVGSGWSLRG